MKKVFSKFFGGFFWTLILLGVVFFVDRTFMGPLVPVTWVEVSDLLAAQKVSSKIFLPQYLPSFISPNPGRLFVRKNPEGWWLQFGQGASVVWLGHGALPPPNEMGGEARCLDVKPNPQARCPANWYFLSAETEAKDVVYLLTNIDKFEAKKVLTVFESARHE